MNQCLHRILCSGVIISFDVFLPFAVEQLDLHLCFIDLNSGAKVTVILDMTCLSR